MGTYKQNRTAEDIKREISAIVRELKDPRVSEHLISVARAEVSSDSSYVKAYVSAVEGMEVAKAATNAKITSARQTSALCSDSLERISIPPRLIIIWKKNVMNCAVVETIMVTPA